MFYSFKTARNCCVVIFCLFEIKTKQIHLTLEASEGTTQEVRGIQQPATVCLGHKSMCGFTIYRMDGRSDSGGTKWFVVVACATDIPAFFHEMFKTAFRKFFEQMHFFSIVGLPCLPNLCEVS